MIGGLHNSVLIICFIDLSPDLSICAIQQILHMSRRWDIIRFPAALTENLRRSQCKRQHQP